MSQDIGSVIFKMCCQHIPCTPKDPTSYLPVCVGGTVPGVLLGASQCRVAANELFMLWSLIQVIQHHHCLGFKSSSLILHSLLMLLKECQGADGAEDGEAEVPLLRTGV